MPDVINVHDLSKEDIQLIQRLVERLRAKGRGKRPVRKGAQKEEDNVEFASWPLGVKGELTREEIYDYL